jgi:general stress protein YciG
MRQRKPRRGFDTMAPERHREIASMGGKAVPVEKRTYARDRALAAEAGRRGGRIGGKAPRGHGSQKARSRALLAWRA